MDKVHTLRIHDPNDNDTRDGSDEIATATAPDGAVEQLVAMRNNGTLQQVKRQMCLPYLCFSGSINVSFKRVICATR